MEDKQSNIETSKPPETTSSPSKENVSKILDATAREIEKVLQEYEIDPKEAVLKVNDLYPDIQSQHFQFGKFAFWGGMVNKWSFPELQTKQEYVPVIKNLRLPIRGKGLGSTIVKIWEKSMEKDGFKDFAITNLSGPKSISFWQEQGYIIPETEKHKKIPYYMSKRLR